MPLLVQYLAFQYYNGYGESILDYKEYRQRV
ncbi:MAG: phospholipase A [Prevotella sp.]|nr:phospholipase A [Prevotella sp.]